VLFCTARDDEVDRVLGLELGADDYLTKPFSPRELVSRVRAVLRRTQGAVAQPPLVLGPVRLDLETREVTVDDLPVALTTTEFDLLAALLRKPGRVLTREQLLSQVWGYEAAAGTRTVDVHVGQVRAKLGSAGDLIRTVRGVGYSTVRA
jgi:DNA-binding response OmpR family regulator